MSLTKLSLGGNNDVIYKKKLFPPRESLVSDIPAGKTGISKSFFYGVTFYLSETSMLSSALIKKKRKFSSSIRKFRWDGVQNHIQGRAS